jgi:hypothetical protein
MPASNPPATMSTSRVSAMNSTAISGYVSRNFGKTCWMSSLAPFSGQLMRIDPEGRCCADVTSSTASSTSRMAGATRRSNNSPASVSAIDRVVRVKSRRRPRRGGRRTGQYAASAPAQIDHRANSFVSLRHTIHGAELIAIRIAQIGKIHPADLGATQARRVLDRCSTVGDPGGMPAIDVIGR